MTVALALGLIGFGAASGVALAFPLAAAVMRPYQSRPAMPSTIDLGVVEGQHRKTDATSADVAGGQRETAFTAGDMR